MTPSRRRLATLLLSLGTVFLLAGILVIKVGAFAPWKALAWPVLLVGLAGVFSVFLLWRCPRCRSFPGPVSATHCRQCGKALDGNEGVLTERVRVDRKIPEEAVLRFRNTVRRLQAIERFGDRAWWIAGVLALVAGGAVFVQSTDLNVAGIAALVVGLVTWFLLHYGYVVAKNGVLVLLRCPQCNKSLVNNLAEYCPHCGTPLPSWA